MILIIAGSLFQGTVYAPVGYFNYVFQGGAGGNNLFGNPLHNQHYFLSEIISHPPEGATVSLWSASLNVYTSSSTFSGGAWSVDLTLPPGQGAKLTTFTTFTNTFVGQILNPDGSPWGDDPMPLPAPFSGPNGVYLLSSKLPATLSGNTLFDYILGRPPKEGEQFTRLDVLTQTYLTTTFLSGAWNNGNPVLQVGEAGFFNVVPEPSTVTLTLVGLFLTGLVAYRQRHEI
jgi:hypothetical protein